jgi:hypothetical protein
MKRADVSLAIVALTPGVDGQTIDLDAWLDANSPTAKSEAVRRSDGYD